MRIVALEEHFSHPDFLGRIQPERIAERGYPLPGPGLAAAMRVEQLADTGPKRLADMEAAGIDVQVLSGCGPGADLLDGQEGCAFARDFNDRLARIVAEGGGHYAAFAHLPMNDPDAAADELERCVTDYRFRGALISGDTNGRFLDHPSFAPILERAERLDVPLYVHPNVPPLSVREAYYSGFPAPVDFLFATAGWGWHAETAVHILRMVLAGTLERHRKLKLIVGHMGEGLPAMLDRCDQVLSPHVSPHLGRTVKETILDQVWITTSGLFSWPPMAVALLTFGIDRVLFSVDYPFGANSVAREFLDHLPLASADKAKIAHGNADRLLKLA